MRRTLTASGPASPELAWDRYAEPARWSSWSPQIVHVSTDERIRSGMRARVDGVPFEVLDVDEAARCWTWRVGWWPVQLTLRHTVEAARDGCTTRLTVDGPSWLVPAYQPLAALALRRLVAV